MDKLEKDRRKRMTINAIPFQDVNPHELLPLLLCLPRQSREKIMCAQDRHGQTFAADELRRTIVNKDDWFEQLIPALREQGHNRLADLLDDPTDAGQHIPQLDRQNDQQREERSQEKAAHLYPKQPKNPTHSAVADSSSSRAVQVTTATHYRQLSAFVVHVLRGLDVPSPIAGSDWMGLAGQLGFNVNSVQRLKALPESPAEALLKEWGKESDATLGKLFEALRAIERFDICQQLEETLGLQPQAQNRLEKNDPPKAKSKVDNPGVNDGPAASVVVQSQMISLGNPVPHQRKTTTPPKSDMSDDEVVQSKPADGSKMSRSMSQRVEGDSDQAKIAVKTSDELPAAEGHQLSADEASQAADGAGDETGVDGSMIAGDQARKDRPKEKNNEDKVAHGNGSDSQDTANSKPSTDMKCAAPIGIGPVSSHMPVNNLNRNGKVGNQDARPTEYDANCTGKTLLSENQQLFSSTSNPSDYSRGRNYCSPEDVIGPLRSDQSIDDELRESLFLFSSASCPTAVPVTNNDEPASDVTATLHCPATRPQAATPPAVPMQTARPIGASSAAVPETAAMRSSVASTQKSSQGGPIQQPEEPSKFFPDILAFPSVDGTYTRDDLVAAVANPTYPSIPQASVRAKQTMPRSSNIHTHQQPLAAPEQVRQPPISATPSSHGHSSDNSNLPEIEKKDEVDNQQQKTSMRDHDASIQQFTEAKDAQEQATTANQQPQLSPQMVEESKGFATNRSSGEMPESQSSTLQSERGARHNPDGTQSGAADDHIGTQLPLPLALNEEEQQEIAEDPHDDQDDAGNGAAAEPQGLRASSVSSLSIAVPVLLSLASALTSGGDFISNLI